MDSSLTSELIALIQAYLMGGIVAALLLIHSGWLMIALLDRERGYKRRGDVENARRVHNWISRLLVAKQSRKQDALISAIVIGTHPVIILWLFLTLPVALDSKRL